VFVFPDADRQQAIPGVAMAAFLLQGQNCVCGSRVFVHASIAEELTAGVAAFAKGMKLGSGLERDTMIGPVISGVQKKRIEGFFASAQQQGARCLTGGAPDPRRGHFVTPTVYVDCRPDMRIVQEEIFGPVLAVQTFRTVEEGIAKANNTPYGLSGGVWTDKGSKIFKVTNSIRAGVLWANTYNKFDPGSPFGGYKESGMGREGGLHGLREYVSLN
jgi:aldehyde dehydrogenase (NAD+)